MASRGQTHDNNVGSISVPSLQKNNAVEFLPVDYSGTDIPVPFPYLPIQNSPLPAENFYGYQQNFSSGAVHDLNMATNVDEHNRYPMDIPVDQDVIVRNDISVSDNQIFNFPSAGTNTMSSGYQTPNSVMNAYQEMSRVPHFENLFRVMNINSINADSCGVQNFHMSVLDAETQNSSRQTTEINRTLTKFGRSAPKFEQSVLPSVYDSEGRVNSSLPNSEDNLDGRFLSLGYQSNIASNVNSNTYGGKAIDMSETFFSSQGQLGNSSYNNVRGSLAGFENNVGGLVTPWDCVGNLTLSGDDYCDMRGLASEHDITSTNLDEGQLNMHHYMPSPSTITSELGTETDSRMCSSDPSGRFGANPRMLSNISGYNEGSCEYMKKRRQRVSFNSSVLRSNHQNAADQFQNTDLSTNLMLPSSGTISGHTEESDKQYKPDLALGTVTPSSAVQAVEGDLLQRSSRLLPAGQGADVTVKSKLPRASRAVNRESLKRNLDLPPRATIQHQRRKVMPQTSAQFSPDLVQNALGRIATGHSTPSVSSSVMSSRIPSARKDFAASGWTRNTLSLPSVAENLSNTVKASQHPTASAEDCIPPNDISCSEETSLAVSSSTMRSPSFLANPSTIPVVAAVSPAPPVGVPPTALARTIATRSGSARIPIPATPSKRVLAAALKARSPISGTAPQKTHLVHSSSNMTHPALSEWRKSLPAHLAALAKAAPAFRASQVPSSMSHIKWQGFDIPPTIGFNCMLCKRDLSFTPEGPVIQPPIPPAVAVLPCGHSFHDHCLLLITPADESKNPPCIPCAMGEK